MTDSNSSAVEEAITYPLPPFGTKLVTIRPDADSLSAAAVLRLRADGVKTSSIDLKLIKWIGAVDRLGFKMAVERHKNLMPKQLERYFAIVAIATNAGRHWREIEDQLLDIEAVLTGRMEFDEIVTLANLLPKANGFGRFQATIVEGVALVIAPGKLRAARSWAGGVYPVSAIFDPQHALPDFPPERRWSIICKPGCFDRIGFETAINQAEADARGVSVEYLKKTGNLWGGPRYIVSSPQGSGHDSHLTQEAILEVVRKHLLVGVRTPVGRREAVQAQQAA